MTGKKYPAIPLPGKSLFLLIVFCFMAVFFLRARLINVYTHNIGGIEQNVIYSIHTLASGTALYTDPEKPLYSFTQYSPLYFNIVAFTGKLAGLDPAEPMSWYRLSRFFSLLFNLLLLLVVYKILRLIIPDDKIIPAGLALLLFIFFEQQDYSRPDSLYHLLFGICFYFFYKVLYHKQEILSLVFMGIFLALALFTKQSAVFLLFLLTVILLFRGETRKKTPWFLLAFIVSVLVLNFLMLNISKDILIKNLYLSILNGFDLIWAIRLYFLTALPRFILFFLVITFLILQWKEMPDAVIRITTLSALYYLGIAFFSGMKWGSGTNYFFEFCLICIPGILFLYQHLLDKQFSVKLIYKICLALTLTMIVPQLLIIAWRDYYKSDKDSYIKAKETVELIKSLPQYSEETRFIIPERRWLSNFLYNKTLFPQPDIYRTLWNSDSDISKIHPSAPPKEQNLMLIRSKSTEIVVHFNIKLLGYKEVLKHDVYQVFIPPTSADSIP